jgi:hypothetical protein
VYNDEEGIWSNTFHQKVKELNLAGQNVTLPAIVQSLHSLLPLILSILHIGKKTCRSPHHPLFAPYQ